MRTTILIRQIRVRRLRCAHHGELLPFRDIIMSNICIILRIRSIPSLLGDDRHGFNGNNTFECQIRLVSKLALEILCGRLVCGE